MPTERLITLIDKIITARTKAACCTLLAESATTGIERTNLTARAAHWGAEADKHRARLLDILKAVRPTTTHTEPLSVGAVRHDNGGGHIEAHSRHRDEPERLVITRYTPQEAIAVAAALLICANDIDPTAQDAVLTQIIPPAPTDR